MSIINRHVTDSGFCREICPGVHWMGGAFLLLNQTPPARLHMSAFLVIGSTGTMLIDTGHPKDRQTITAAIRDRLAGRMLDYIMPTHQEYPHAGNLEHLLTEFPESTAIGDTRDYHLYMPQHAGRMLHGQPGNRFDLGDRVVTLLPAPIHDLPATIWAWDDRNGIMFVSDGFSFTHQEGFGTALSTEMPEPSRKDAGYVNEKALYWPKFAEADSVVQEVEALLRRFPSHIIAPSHGPVITNPDAMGPLLLDALREHRNS